MKNLPSNYTLIYSSKQISDAITRIGEQITIWAEKVTLDTKNDLLTVPVLRGGLFFFADLVRTIKISVDVAPSHASAYNSIENTLAADQFKFSLDELNLTNRSVLIVDDISDSGTTLSKLSEQILLRGALEVKSAVLINRKKNPLIQSPDWSCFTHLGDEWLVGYGMDDSDRWRNLDSVYAKNK